MALCKKCDFDSFYAVDVCPKCGADYKPKSKPKATAKKEAKK